MSKILIRIRRRFFEPILYKEDVYMGCSDVAIPNTDESSIYVK